MKLLRNTAFAVTLLCFGGSVHAGKSDVSTKLGKAVETLTAVYKNTQQVKINPKVAVFTFNTSKELQKRRIGFAVSEILVHKMAATGLYTLVERTELSSVLRELNLSMSGVTVQEDALKAGNLAHADVLILGSVEKFGADYHVNSRMVSAETGEVLATSYETLPAEAFEKEAGEYVTLVPRTQTIGLYFLYGYRGTAALASTTKSTTMLYDYTMAVSPMKAVYGMPGLGIRYSPSSRLQFDVSYSNTGKPTKTGDAVVSYTDHASVNGRYAYKYTTKGYAIRALAGANWALTRKFTLFTGAGGTSIKLTGEGTVTYFTPTLALRAEFHPQERISLSISGNYDFIAKTASGNEWTGASLNTARLKRFYWEPSLALYF